MKNKMGNAPEAPSEAENTAHNHNAVKSAAQRVSGNASKMCTDYSIPGKKMGEHK